MDPAIYQGTDHDGTLVIHHAIEDLIRKYPDHYHWSYKRFKANPELDNLYTLNEEDALANVEQVRQANRERLNAATTYTTDDKILSAHSLNQT